jgi:hypothetical protein
MKINIKNDRSGIGGRFIPLVITSNTFYHGLTGCGRKSKKAENVYMYLAAWRIMMGEQLKSQ